MDLEEMTASTNQMKKQSYQEGFNESIKQIEFLQHEVLSCKNIFAEANTKIYELEEKNKTIILFNEKLKEEKIDIEKQNIKIKELVNFYESELKEKSDIESNMERENSEKHTVNKSLNNQCLEKSNEIHLLKNKNIELEDK